MPVAHCQTLLIFIGLCATSTGAFTSFLFFLRVRAVYLKSTLTTCVFGILWFVVLSLGVYGALVTSAEHLPASRYCTDAFARSFELPMLPTFVLDTLVFVAISFRLACNATSAPTWRSRLSSAVTGEGLFKVSRSLMQSGQIYYLGTILLFFANAAVMKSSLPPSSWNYSLISEYLCFVNILACLVFRGVALGTIEEFPGLSSSEATEALFLSPQAI